MRRPPKPGDLYKHFKNRLYKIITVAIHTETGEKFVIYRPFNDPTTVCARPYDMFMSEVDKEKYPDVKAKYRFTFEGRV